MRATPHITDKKVPSLTDRERLLLSMEVYEAVLAETNTFHGRTGGNLAYLLGAISTVGTSKKCAVSKQSEIAKILRKRFNKSHPVWDFIEVVCRGG